jgi:hypothetical protein
MDDDPEVAEQIRAILAPDYDDLAPSVEAVLSGGQYASLSV